MTHTARLRPIILLAFLVLMLGSASAVADDTFEEKLTAPGSKVVWFDTEFDPRVLTWREFRQSVIGTTYPADATGRTRRSSSSEPPTRERLLIWTRRSGSCFQSWRSGASSTTRLSSSRPIMASCSASTV